MGCQIVECREQAFTLAWLATFHKCLVVRYLGAMLGRLPPERPEALPNKLLRNIFELLMTIKPQIEVFE